MISEAMAQSILMQLQEQNKLLAQLIGSSSTSEINQGHKKNIKTIAKNQHKQQAKQLVLKHLPNIQSFINL